MYRKQRRIIVRRKTKLPELLSPAGSSEALIAAVNAGADAVYVGTDSFNARMNAKNFSYDELYFALLYAHTHGVKLYVTLNTLLFDRELCDFINHCRIISDMGVDAAIVADVGAVSLIKRYVPSLPLHASTQMSLHSVDGVSFASKMGLERVVPARELSLENIKSIIDLSPAEVEVFLHGALCVSYSGQCLFSSLVGGRSGNRGVCAQACRLPYNGTYPLSLCDLSLSHHIPELIDIGVSSLKIEGRMKSPDYVFGVTSIYRRLLDEGRASTKKEDKTLEDIFSRQGFTDNYFTGRITEKMTGVRTDSQKSRTSEIFTDSPLTDTKIKKAEISGTLSIKRGEHSTLTLSLGDKSVTVGGAVPSDAINQPITHDSVIKQITKTGQTSFVLPKENLTVELDCGLNMPISEQNSLRRAATDALSLEYARPPHKITDPELLTDKDIRIRASVDAKSTDEEPLPIRTAFFFDVNAYNEVCEDIGGFFDIIFLPLHMLDRAKKKPNGICLPPIITDSEREKVCVMLRHADRLGIKYALCGNIGHLPLLHDTDMEIIGDFRLNITNSHTALAFKRSGIKRYILSPELTLPQMRDISCAVPGACAIVFGRIPLMLTERCFVRENGGCGKCSSFNFCDRTGARFPVVREYPHRNIILNSIQTYMGDRQSELSDYAISSYHFIFTTESAQQVRLAVSDFKNEARRDKVRRIAPR